MCGDSQLGGDFRILLSRRGQQYDAGALDQANRKRPRPRASLQRFLLFGIQANWESDTHPEEPLYCRDVHPSIMSTTYDALH
jgi:hypothetical protein